MASVRLKPGSSIWYACYKVPTGKIDDKGNAVFARVQKSSGTLDKDRALQMAISYERAAVAASERRWTERAAQRFVAELNAIAQIDPGQVEPLEPFLRRWLVSRKKGVEPATYEKYEAAVTAFIGYLGKRSAGTLADVTHSIIAKFRDSESAKGKSPTTVNAMLRVLAQAFAEAVTMEILRTNPARGLNVKGAKKAKQSRRAFTFEQFRALVAACDGDWKTLVLVCGYTGARQQEAAHLQWSQVDLAGNRITLQRSKTGDEHWLPLHPALAAHLRALGGKDGPVMPKMDADNRRDIASKFRRRILPKIGIKQAYAKSEGEGRTVADYSLHSFRHGLATWLNAAGVPELMRMRIVGHEDEAISRGYTHTEFAQLSAELGKIPSV